MDAISEFKRLIKHRTDPSFWESNIIAAHEMCANEDDHKLFYRFLCTPRSQFNPNIVQESKTLGELMDDPNFVNPIQELPDELTQDIYQNGNETIIRTRLKKVDTDDEKAPPNSLMH
jgi:hypothetical protein